MAAFLLCALEREVVMMECESYDQISKYNYVMWPVQLNALSFFSFFFSFPLPGSHSLQLYSGMFAQWTQLQQVQSW